MSLVGSLEDLGFADLLQIVSMSGRSGVLTLRGPEGEGRIVLRDGLVRGAVFNGSPEDLPELLVGGGFVSEEELNAAAAEALSAGSDLERVLAERGVISSERMDSLRSESVQAVVLRLFQWSSGEFNFDTREVAESDDPPCFAPSGISPQSLALEAARLSDEASAGRGEEAVLEPSQPFAEAIIALAPESEEEDAPSLGAGRPSQGGPADAMDSGAEPSATERSAAAESEQLEEDLGGEEQAFEFSTELSAISGAEPTAPECALSVAPSDATPAQVRAKPAVVVIDGDLVALEWTKKSLTRLFARVHIFQRCEHALERIRQYLTTVSLPLVLLSPRAAWDAPHGTVDSTTFLRQLKAQAPRTPVIWLAEAGSPPLERISPADGLITRPPRGWLTKALSKQESEQLAEQFRVDLLERLVRIPGFADEPGGRRARPILQVLAESTARLSDASESGGVLPVVIEFAAEFFSRVVLFRVRDDVVIGMAQSGLDRDGGPEDDALGKVVFPIEEAAWLRTVCSGGSPIRAAPRDDGDAKLASLLGDQLPAEAYLAPIQSGGEIVALVYGDNLPGESPIRNTTALEVILHHAGLALDRAALERALAAKDENSAFDSPSPAN